MCDTQGDEAMEFDSIMNGYDSRLFDVLAQSSNRAYWIFVPARCCFRGMGSKFFCNNVGIIVCAEGVENTTIMGIVNEAGAELLQGYYFDRPLRVEEFYDKYVK